LQGKPILYDAEGVLYSVPLYFAAPPPDTLDNEELEYEIYGDFVSDVPQPQLVDDAGNPFIPDGTEQQAFIAVELFSANGRARTPFIYGLGATYPPVTVNTPADDVEITAHVQGLSLRVPQSAVGVTASFDIVRPSELDDSDSVDYVARLRELDNRPFKIEVGGYALMDGYLEIPSYNDSWHEDGVRLRCTANDGFASLNRYLFRDPLPFDGSTLSANLEYLLDTCGVTERSIARFPSPEDPEEEYEISQDGWRAGGYRFSYRANAGDSVGQWIQTLIDTHFPHYIYGFRPSGSGNSEFFVKSHIVSDEEIEDSPKIYSTIQDAIDYLVDEHAMTEVDASKIASQITAQNLYRRSLPAEATEVRITGYDRIKEQFLQAYKIDEVAEDPELPTVERPRNWCGEKRVVAMFDNRLSSQKQVEEICYWKFEQLTKVRDMIEFDCGLIMHEDGRPLWRGDVFRLIPPKPPGDDDEGDPPKPPGDDDEGDPEPIIEGEVYRIVAMDMRFSLENEEEQSLARVVHYTCERIGEETPWGGRAFGTTIADIYEARVWRNWANKNGGDMMTGQPILAMPVAAGG
jgi:hypothetical protein